MKRPHQQPVTDLSYLSSPRSSALGNGTEQLAFDNLAAALEAEKIFDPATERPRELECNRRGWRIMIRL